MSSKKFGTITGVLIPNITMMFGVILFLRLGVITAHAGLFTMLSIIGFSLMIMIITSFSIGCIVTNMRVGAGGVYYIVSRLLGIEIGGAIGIALFGAQLISMVMTISGFGLSICEIFPELSLQAVELATLAVLVVISGVSASWALKSQGVILIILIAAILSVLFGSPENISGSFPLSAFYSGGTLSYWHAFALFYPALTGIEAGMALSGNLKNPGRSLYIGNLFSLFFCAGCYALIAIVAYIRIPADVLLNDEFALVNFAFSSDVVLIGIWGATLSSAIGCLLGAPRILQSMAQDGVITKYFAVTSGKRDEPRRALLFTALATGILLLSTTMDQVIPMLSMICLASYGIMNIVASALELMNTPSWRPRLRTHWTTSFFGAVCILVTMFMINAGWAFGTLLILTVIYIMVRARNIDSGFQDLRESFIFFVSRLALYRLGAPSEHALTWHPQLLVLSQAPSEADVLVRLAHSLTRRSGILTLATVVPEDWQQQDKIQLTRESLARHFEKENIECLCEVYPENHITSGHTQLIKAYGIGPIQPNTVFLDISGASFEPELVDIIETAQFMQKNLVLASVKSDASLKQFTSVKGSRKKQIDVHWDPQETAAFDLTMSLVTTLTDGRVFASAKVRLCAEVMDENAQSAVSNHLDKYVKTGRLNATIYTTELFEQKTPATICCVALRPLSENATDDEKLQYYDYLQEQYKKSSMGQVTLFVTSYDNVDHREIYLPESNTASR